MRYARQKTTIKWFRPEPDNVEDLKSMYRKLAMEHHPDRGGDKITMQEINGEYSVLFEALKDIHKSTRPDGPRTYEARRKKRRRRRRTSSGSSMSFSSWTGWRWSFAAAGSGSAARRKSTRTS